MKKIVCNLNLFDINQNVYIIDYETDSHSVKTFSQISMDELPNFIQALAEEEQVETIVLNGENTYCKAMAENVAKYFSNNYSTNKINIEVM